MDNGRGNAAEGRNHVFVPQYRSGGCTVRGIRQTLEDALICVDHLDDQLRSRGAFYGVGARSTAFFYDCFCERLSKYVRRKLNKPYRGVDVCFSVPADELY